MDRLSVRTDRADELRAKYPAVARVGTLAMKHRLVLIGVVALALGWFNGRELRIGDAVQFAAAGDRLLHGHLGIFADETLQAGPVHVLHLGIMRILAMQLHIQEDLFASIFLHLMFAFLAVALVRLYLKVNGSEGSASLEIYAAILALAGGVADVANINGHSEEALIPILWIFAGLMMRKRRPWLAGALIGVAAGMKLWGGIGVAVLFIAPSADLWFRSMLVCGATIVGIYGPFFAFSHVATFHYVWFIQPHTLIAKLGADGQRFSWPMRILQGALSTSVAGGIARLYRHSRHVIWAAALAGIAVRLILDPVDLDYYWIGVAMTAVVGAAVIAIRATPWWRVPVAGAAYLLLYPAFLGGGTWAAAWSLTVAMGTPSVFRKQDPLTSSVPSEPSLRSRSTPPSIQ